MDPMAQKLETRLLDGDPAAAAEVEQWVRQAARSFAHRLGDSLDDAVQDSILEVLAALREGRYRDRGAFRGFVWRTTSSNCLDRLRWRRRWVEVEIDTSALPSDEAAAITRLLSTETVDRFRRLLARQSRHCRELWREILAGRSYREMSERFGSSAGALRVRVLRCRRRALAMWLEDGGNGPAAESLNTVEE